MKGLESQNGLLTELYGSLKMSSEFSVDLDKTQITMEHKFTS